MSLLHASIQAEDRLNSIQAAIDSQRLLQTAMALVAVPSPTRHAGAVADTLAAILSADGFTVERPVADWPEAPAVVVRYDSGRPGRVLQFDGHLDTVHLDFIPPRFENGVLYGSGASDMKGGIAAFVEALRALAATGALPGGGILLTAHDHHEGPWGDRRQLRALLREGYVGDGVLLPEYMATPLPLACRGSVLFDLTISRAGVPTHEVLCPPGTPNVIGAGAEVVRRLQELHAEISQISAPYAGHDSVFVGQIHAGTIYNQSPTECHISGVRRWVTPGVGDAAVAELQAIFDEVAAATNTTVQAAFDIPGDAVQLDQDDSLVQAFQAAHTQVAGAPLPFGGKMFVDDGNIFSGEGGIPAITHGPAATGAHTLNEAVTLEELVRVAQVYAMTAVRFCGRSS